MSWKEIFLLPFNMAMRYTKNPLGLKTAEEEKQYPEAMKIRRFILDAMSNIVSELEFSDIYQAVYGEDYVDCADDTTTDLHLKDQLTMLDELMEQENVDVIDRILMAWLHKYFTIRLEEVGETS
jgi:hypothetical protein